MDEEVAESMKSFIETSMKTIDQEVRKCNVLKDELHLCKSERKNLQSNIRTLELEVLRQQTCRVSVFDNRPLKSGGRIVVQLRRSSEICAIVNLTSEDPCPTPLDTLMKAAYNNVIDPARTMCDIWSTWHKHERNEIRRQLRQAKRRETYTKATVTQAFGGCAVAEDAPVFQAALGFMKGCQLKNRRSTNGPRYYVGRRCSVVDKSPEKRCMNKNRKKILHDMMRHMYDGYVVKEVERTVLKRKRFSTVNLARVSDMHSTFNASAVGSIAKCEGGKVKGEMGLLCSETTLRRTMDLVHDQAVQLGFSYMPEGGLGKVWCWGDSDSLLQKAVNLYVKAIYYDACCEGVTEDNPWIVPVTGDGVRTSQRGTFVTVMGAKQSDARLKNQERAGHSVMCQSCDMYTPAVAGFASESEIMEYFHALVSEFQKIERQGFCLVNGHAYKVPIKVYVVADLSFLHKYVQRGGSSHSSTCFCMMCSAFRNFRHEGYPGGCLKCRSKGIVYGTDGIQKCKHHDACTPEFLAWQTERYRELCALVPNLPLTVLPSWESVDELRRECMKRCVGEHASELKGISRTAGKNYYTGEALTNWILQYCRGGCTLSNDANTGVMHCDIRIVTKCLTDRNVACQGMNEVSKRRRMQSILQLEQEYTKMTMYMRDKRFSPTHPSSLGIPMDRIILCLLHLPMRTHEKVLTLLFHSACEHRTHKKSKPILDAMVVILRRLGNMSENWTYKMDEKNTTIVQKIKLHWDQSKSIFKPEHLKDLEHIVKLAVPAPNQANWILFLKQYIACINLLTVSRDYTAKDLEELELACDETYRLLVAHCGGDKAVTNYFHYIGAGHVLWMCQMRGNIWRYRNEGVEAFNKTLSKRYNMFNSSGNKGNLSSSGKVQPFEVLGKWMGRYVMWQLGFANNLFIGKGGVLGPSEVEWDANAGCFMPSDQQFATHEVCSDEDELYSASDTSLDSDSEDLDQFTPEDYDVCARVSETEVARTLRKRPICL
jgi:hypothetical protein